MDEYTWGISGPAFLVLFLSATVIVIIGTALHRRALFAGPADTRVDTLTPQQVAFLNGGRRLAVETSIAWLRHEGVLDVTAAGELVRTGADPAGSTALDMAVLHAAGRGQTFKLIRADANVISALTQLHAQLETMGLAVSDQVRQAARRGPNVLLLLAALGVARAAVGFVNNRPTLFLFLALVPLVIVALAWRRRSPFRTKAATRALAVLRLRHAAFAPAGRPGSRTPNTRASTPHVSDPHVSTPHSSNLHAPMATAMAVGLFGGLVLWDSDPAFAELSGIEQENRWNTGNSSSGYADGGGYTGGDGGSSCGGGSGGDSGGGSSCGGGGGCGGGGCGG